MLKRDRKPKESPIRTARKRAKLTQAELGKRVGITAAAVCNYETGRDTPRPAVAKRLCEELKVHQLTLDAIYRASA